MHELLATVLHVVGEDALDQSSADEQSELDEVMAAILDAEFVEHDAYVLFSKLMEHAQSFYEVADGSGPHRATAAPGANQEQRSAIVDRSRVIHQVFLAKVDPELAVHLTDIEILPQIFLM